MAELPDGTLASGSGDKTVRIWNTNSGLQLKVLTLNYNLFVVHKGIGRLVFIQ